MLFGGQGRDTLFGNRGDDSLVGNRGADELLGGMGDDTLKGGKGADVLDGGHGQNRLTGGDDADTFNIAQKGGVDVITDFVSGTDKISLQGSLTFKDVSFNETQKGNALFVSVEGTAIARVNGVTELTASDFV